MTSQKRKRGIYQSIPAVSWIWENPANPADCVRSVYEGLADCWARKPELSVADSCSDFVVTDQSGKFYFFELKHRLADYLHGAGTAMNPLPYESAHFFESDLEAMASDWDAAISDMYAVLKAADSIKNYGHLKHDQPAGRREQKGESGKLERERSKAVT